MKYPLLTVGLCAGAAALALAAAPAFAQVQTGARFAATTLDVSARGEAHVPPDMATIDLGVSAEAPDAASAMRQNAEAMAKVVAALRAGGIDARDIRTSSIGLTPQYAYAQGQPRRLTGYEADNRVAVKVNDLGRLGADIDAAVGAGATNVGEVSFGLKNPVSAENYARLAAVKALEDKASILAEASGYHIRRLVNLTETGAAPSPPPPRPMMAMAMARAAPATPVEAGEMVVGVEVTGEFELAR
ncbi:MAG: SIMPL domain-containing protein [Caulobacteraceae bacterium]